MCVCVRLQETISWVGRHHHSRRVGVHRSPYPPPLWYFVVFWSVFVHFVSSSASFSMPTELVLGAIDVCLLIYGTHTHCVLHIDPALACVARANESNLIVGCIVRACVQE